MIALSKQKLAACLLLAAVVGGTAGYHLAPPAKERPVLKFLQKVLKLGGFLFFVADDERQHYTHSVSAVGPGDHIDHKRAF